MPTKNTKNTNYNYKTTGNYTVCTWEEIEYPGCYLEVETGRLYRMTENIVAPGHSPLFSIVCKEPTHYVRLTDDPCTPISKVRMYAANEDYWTNF
jgi:hypothetical protein